MVSPICQVNRKKCPVAIFSHGYNGTNSDFAMNSEYLVVNGVGAYCFDFWLIHCRVFSEDLAHSY